MAHTYKFKDEFEKKLKGVKRKFMRNYNNYDSEYRISFKELNKTISFNNFISNAFIWSETPEEEIYWLNVSNR